MNGRNWTSLTELTPGASISPRNNINTGSGGTYEVGAAYTSGGADSHRGRVKFQHQTTKGLQILTHYTYSKHPRRSRHQRAGHARRRI